MGEVPLYTLNPKREGEREREGGGGLGVCVWGGVRLLHVPAHALGLLCVSADPEDRQIALCVCGLMVKVFLGFSRAGGSGPRCLLNPHHES